MITVKGMGGHKEGIEKVEVLKVVNHYLLYLR